MDPSTRLYNPNGPGEPRKRATRVGKRTGAARPHAAAESAAPVAPRSRTRTLAKVALPEPPPPVPVEAEVEHIEQDPALAGDAGPVVGIDDFEEIFTRFQTPITNFVFRLVGNREQAYDLTQDVFVKAYRALSSGTTIQSAALSSWLYRIASNTATDALRRRRLISWLPLSLFNEDRGVGAGMPGSENPNPQQLTAEENLSVAAGAFMGGYDGGRFEQRVADREIVESVLKKLPPKYAACLLLYEHEGFSCAEIAEVLNVSPSAVKMRLMRARERFIQLYQQETGH